MIDESVLVEPSVKRLVMEPLCSIEEAVKQFEGLYLKPSHVKMRLTESTQIVTPA